MSGFFEFWEAWQIQRVVGIAPAQGNWANRYKPRLHDKKWSHTVIYSLIQLHYIRIKLVGKSRMEIALIIYGLQYLGRNR